MSPKKILALLCGMIAARRHGAAAGEAVTKRHVCLPIGRTCWLVRLHEFALAEVERECLVLCNIQQDIGLTCQLLGLSV
jgi:hypothetical protein